MSSSESDSSVVADDEDEEEQIYQLIYEMNSRDDKEAKEVQSPASSGPTPLYLEITAEVDGPEDETTHDITRAQGREDQDDYIVKEPDIDGLDNIQGIIILKANAAEKPWRKAGANISDYFNYGFDEESWNTYCKKQSKLRAAHRKLYTKIMGQRGHTSREEKACSAPTSRQSRAASKAIGRRHGPSSRAEGNSSQVDTEMSPYLSPPSTVSSILEFSPPPSLLHGQRRPPLPPFAALDSEHPEGPDDPSTSLYPCSSGVPSSIPMSMSSRAGVIDTARAWEHFIRQELCVRDRSREYSRDEDDKRGRDVYTERRFFSRSSEEECTRDTAELGHRRHSLERFSGENEERHQKTRHGVRSEGQQKSSCSSSSRNRRDCVEDRDSQSRHKRKKAKRNRKRRKKKKKKKKTSEMLSADQEGK